jgi:hypothetical protein
MMLVRVTQARRAVQQVLGLLVLVAAGRFAYTSFERWSVQGEGAASQSPSGPAAPPTPSPPLAGAAADPLAGQLIAVVLHVSDGQRRSEVFLDGAPLGHTTYVGDVSCRRGTDVTIRIQPKRGSPIERVRRCDGQMIEVKEP